MKNSNIEIIDQENENNVSEHSILNTMEFEDHEDKYLYCWGFGKYGQLGKKFVNYSLTPIMQEVDSREEIFFLSAGESHSAFLTSIPSILYTFGKNYFGQLGLGKNFYTYSPSEVPISKLEKFTKVSCGGDHTLALSEDGSLYTWGLNVFGQLGLGDFLARNSPVKVDFYESGIFPFSEHIVDIAAGAQHSLILTNKNRLFSCGYSQNFSLGYETDDDTHTFRHISEVVCKNHVEKISCGVYHSGCIIDNDIILLWGVGEVLKYEKPTYFNLNAMNGSLSSSQIVTNYQVSDKSVGGYLNSPNKKQNAINFVKDLKIGEDIVYVVSKNDDLFGLGDNKFGQMGNKKTQENLNFEKINVAKIKQLEVGYNFVIIVSVENKIYGWGSNEYGQLGLTNQIYITEPTFLEEISNLGVSKLACGGYHSLGLFTSLLPSDVKKDDHTGVKSINYMPVPGQVDKVDISKIILEIKKTLKQSNLNSTIKKDFQNISEKVKFYDVIKKSILDMEATLNVKENLIKELKIKESEIDVRLEEINCGKVVTKPPGRFPVESRGFNNDFEIDFSELEFGEGDDEIGKGTFGDVRKGHWRKELIAVKFLKPDMISSEDNVAAFIEECNILKNLRHPNILLFMGASTKSKHFFVVTEFCESGNLFELLHQHRNINLTWEDKRRIALETALGMNYLHSFDPPILHRDLKSMNVLLDKNFQVKIADFGSTKFLDVQMTKQKGTFQWMAPEVIKGSTYSEKADVFSFGIILNELATRQPPYYGVDKKEVARSVANKPDYRPAFTKYVPKDWIELMCKCWEHDARRRPTFNDVIDSLMKMKFK